MRVVIDTNCLIQIIPRKSIFHNLWKLILNGDLTLCVSNEIINEYMEILQRLIDIRTAELVITTIIENPYVEFFSPTYRFNLITADPDDNKFVDCAIVSQAKCIVSNDNHYSILKDIEFPKVEVFSLSEFSFFFNEHKNIP